MSRRSATWIFWIGLYVALVLLTTAVVAAVEASDQTTATPPATHSPMVVHAKGHRAGHAPKAQLAHPRASVTFAGAFVDTLGPAARDWGIAFLLGLLVAAISKASSAANQRSLAAAAAAAQERQHQIDAFMAAPLSPVVPDQLVLQPGETCYWQERAQLMELRTHTHYEGGSLGMSVRIARGVYLRPGAFRGDPVSNTAMEIDDTGTVYVTNTRIVFIGGSGAKNVTLKQIAGVEGFTDGVRIAPANKKPLVFITGNWRLVAVIDRVTSGAIGAQTQSAAISLPGGAGPLLLAALQHLDKGKRQGDAIVFPGTASVSGHPVVTLYAPSGRTLPDGRILVGMYFSVDPKDAVAFEQEAHAWVAATMGGQQAVDAWRAAATAKSHAPAPDFVAREQNGQFSVVIPVDPAKAGLALFGDMPPDHGT